MTAPVAPPPTAARAVAVIGAGWAGLAAAVRSVQAGHAVTLFEASAQPGGRARALRVSLPDGATQVLDNGQHILIGAYTETLRLMRDLGLQPESLLLRLPLSLVGPDGRGLRLPDWRAPVDVVAGIVGHTDWTLTDRLSLLGRAARWQWAGFRCAPSLTVNDLCRGLPDRVMRDLIEPLCVSALNTPAAQASAAVFLRVLRDALFATPGGSRLLLPRVDLGRLLPEAAWSWLSRQGADLRPSHRVRSLARADDRWWVDDQPFDAVVLACPPGEAARLVEASNPVERLQQWARQARALGFESIATVYLRAALPPHRPMPLPMLALPSTAQAPAQFVFDRDWLERGQPGAPVQRRMLAYVVSACDLPREELLTRVVQQAQAQMQVVQPEVVQCVVEKRATFACTPGLVRPAAEPGGPDAPGLHACGDWVEGPYPATLEGAVRSGEQVARRLSQPEAA